MQVVNTPYTQFAASTSTWDAVESDLIEGGLIATYTPPVGEIISIPNPGTDPVITVTVSGQPRTVTVGGIDYQQVATNPSPGQYTYNALTNAISVSLQLLSSSPVTPDSNPIIIQENTIPIKYGYHRGERLLDYVPEEEIGLDFIAFLGSISAGGESGIILEMEFSKGGLPTLTAEIQVTNDSLTDALDVLNAPDILYRKFVIYGISFYLNPFTITDNELKTAATIRLNFESINAPRSQYNQLDRLTYIAPSDPGSFIPSTLTQLGKDVPIEAPKVFITTKKKDVTEQRTLRSVVESTAINFGGFIDYTSSVKIVKNDETPVLILPDDISILPEVTIEINGIPGAGIVDGVLLSSPWIFRAWQPDASELIIAEEEEINSIENSSDPLILVSMGEPDNEPTSPTKQLVGNGYFYTDYSELENFPLAAQNPSALSYPTGFSKASWDEARLSGFKLYQLNGKRYGWEVLSTQVWSFIDPPLAGKPDIKFSLEPIWAFKPPVATAHWKQVQTWNLTIGFDDEGYSTIENETGIKRMQAKSESDQRTAAQLHYDAEKLQYEANVLYDEAASLDGEDQLAKFNQAADKKKLSEEKAEEIKLYQYYDVPYTKTVSRYYRRLSAVNLEIKDDERPAKFLEREISTESGFIFIPNPVRGEPPIIIGETAEFTYDLQATKGGYVIIRSSRTVNQQGDSAKDVTREYVEGTPPPAPRIPKRRRPPPPESPPPEPPEPGIFYYSTPVGSQHVNFFQASRESVSVPGLRSQSLAYIALLGICREQNLSSETTSLDTLWFREINPGDRAWFRGRLWQCTQIARRDRIQSSGLIQCLSFSTQWGSWLESLFLSGIYVPEEK